MKFIVIGLGNFGASLAKKLTAMGHEVIGVDKDEEKVEFFKDKITNTICLDATDIHGLKILPLKDSDHVIVAIGDDFGISIKISAMLKKLNVKNITSRESASIHKTVLNAIEIKDTINPEHEFAEEFAERLILKKAKDVYDISQEIKVISIPVPKRCIDKLLGEVDIFTKLNITLLGIKKPLKEDSSGELQYRILINKDLIPNLIIEPNDVLIVLGSIKDVQKLI